MNTTTYTPNKFYLPWDIAAHLGSWPKLVYNASFGNKQLPWTAENRGDVLVQGADRGATLATQAITRDYQDSNDRNAALARVYVAPHNAEGGMARDALFALFIDSSWEKGKNLMLF